MKIRVRFAKTGNLKFIGHLDVMRYFQKALRRTEVDVMYSQGYSPHQIMSFASPLGIGLTSQGEYMDIEVAGCGSSEQMVSRLNQVMADGMKIVSFRKLSEEGKTNAMALVAAADYRVCFRAGYESRIDSLAEKWTDFMDQPGIVIMKKTKKSEAEVDIKPLIVSTSFDGVCFEMRLSAGSVQNLKPEAVIGAFYDFLGMELSPFALEIHRLDMYACVDGRYVSLEDLGEEIYE